MIVRYVTEYRISTLMIQPKRLTVIVLVKADDVDSISDPPVFLRFINLLVNDATFLLDEALSVSVFDRSSMQVPVRLWLPI